MSTAASKKTTKTRARPAKAAKLTVTTRKRARASTQVYVKPAKIIRSCVESSYAAYFYRVYKNLVNAYSGEPRKSAKVNETTLAEDRAKYAWIFTAMGVDHTVFTIRRAITVSLGEDTRSPALRLSRTHLYHICNQMVGFLRNALRKIGGGTSDIKTAKAWHLRDVIRLELRTTHGVSDAAVKGLTTLIDTCLNNLNTADGDTVPYLVVSKPSRKDTRRQLKTLLARNNIGSGVVEVVACTFIWAMVLAQKALSDAVVATEDAGKSTASLVSSKKGRSLAKERLGQVLMGTPLGKLVRNCDAWILKNATKMAVGRYGTPFIATAVADKLRALGGEKTHVRLYNGVTAAVNMVGNAFLVRVRELLQASEHHMKNKHRITAEDIRDAANTVVDPAVLQPYLQPAITRAVYVPRKPPSWVQRKGAADEEEEEEA